MIIRRRLFTADPWSDFWSLVDGFSRVRPTGEGEVDGTYATIAYLALWHGTLRGSVLAWGSGRQSKSRGSRKRR